MQDSRLLSADMETTTLHLPLPSLEPQTLPTISSSISQVLNATHGSVKRIVHLEGNLAESHIGFGFGENMKGTAMFIVYLSSNGKSKTILSHHQMITLIF